MAAGNQERMEAELGDLLFAIVNLGRFMAINPEEALRKTMTRFTARFEYVEDSLHEQGRKMTDATLEEMDLLWEEAKRVEKEN
jgi:tetrapyrrole methylase family protein / MazG family protein